MIPCPSDFRSIMSTCLFQPSWNNSKTLYVNECFVRKRWLAALSSVSSISRNLLLSSSGHLPFVLCLCSLCDLAAIFIPYGFKILSWAGWLSRCVNLITLDLLGEFMYLSNSQTIGKTRTFLVVHACTC